MVLVDAHVQFAPISVYANASHTVSEQNEEKIKDRYRRANSKTKAKEVVKQQFT